MVFGEEGCAVQRHVLTTVALPMSLPRFLLYLQNISLQKNKSDSRNTLPGCHSVGLSCGPARYPGVRRDVEAQFRDAISFRRGKKITFVTTAGNSAEGSNLFPAWIEKKTPLSCKTFFQNATFIRGKRCTSEGSSVCRRKPGSLLCHWEANKCATRPRKELWDS